MKYVFAPHLRHIEFSAVQFGSIGRPVLSFRPVCFLISQLMKVISFNTLSMLSFILFMRP